MPFRIGGEHLPSAHFVTCRSLVSLLLFKGTIVLYVHISNVEGCDDWGNFGPELCPKDSYDMVLRLKNVD